MYSVADCAGQELAKTDPAKAKEMANEMRRKEVLDFQASKKGATFGYGNEVMCDSCKKFYLSIQRCARCKVTWYCSRKCQKDDWATHKFVCAEEQKRREAEVAAKGFMGVCVSSHYLTVTSATAAAVVGGDSVGTQPPH